MVCEGQLDPQWKQANAYYGLLRAYLLAEEWDNASSLLQRKPSGLKSFSGPSGELREETARLLIALANGQPLDELGDLSGLLEADYLPLLLGTDGFAGALKCSGRSLHDVLPEIWRVVQPERNN
jgi:hypothetical protein